MRVGGPNGSENLGDGNWAKNAIKNNKQGRKEVAARDLEADETCCVCCDNLHTNEDLSHCRYGCGRQIHTDCLMRCFKHNKQEGKAMVCPLCRTKWDDGAIEYLEERKRLFRQRKAESAKQEAKAAKKVVLEQTLTENNKYCESLK